MDKADLIAATVDHIKSLAQQLGHTPTIGDFDLTCDAAGLPIWNSLTQRIERSWTSMILAADLTPNKPGPRAQS